MATFEFETLQSPRKARHHDGQHEHQYLNMNVSKMLERMASNQGGPTQQSRCPTQKASTVLENVDTCTLTLQTRN